MGPRQQSAYGSTDDDSSCSLLLPLTIDNDGGEIIDDHVNTKRNSNSIEEVYDSITKTATLKAISNSLIIISCGQALSFTLACSAAANSTLYDACHFSAPTAQTMLVYSLLSPHLLFKYMYINEDENDNVHGEAGSSSSAKHVPKWAYLAIAFLDMEANYLSVLAFRYTSLTSITLLDALAIPASMMFSRLFIFFQHRRAYSSRQFFGVFVCIIGLVAMGWSDAGMDEDDDNNTTAMVYDKALWGDALALIGGIIYGLNDVIAEKFVKDFDRLEVCEL